MDVLVVLTSFCLRGGSVEWSVGESLAFLETGGDWESMDRTSPLVFFPSRTGDVAADDSFDLENLELADLHTAVLEHSGFVGGN